MYVTFLLLTPYVLSVAVKRGWTRDTLKIGDKVTVHAFPAKDASHSADGRKLTLANGQTLAMGPSR